MTLEELEKRVRALEDAEEIKTLHREYLFYIQNLEIEKALDCFAENIITDVANYGIIKGKEAVGKFFRETIRRNVETGLKATGCFTASSPGLPKGSGFREGTTANM